MNTIAVLVNDAPHAEHLLRPMLAPRPDTRWILVACAPRLTRRIGKFASHASREQWRARWSERLFEQLAPLFAGQPGGAAKQLVAQKALPDVLDELRRQHAGLQMLDARQPRLGEMGAPVDAGEVRSAAERWTVPLLVSSGLGLALSLSD